MRQALIAGLVLRVPAGGRQRRSAPYGRQAAFFWRWRPPTPAALAPSRCAPYALRYARLPAGPFVPPACPAVFLRTSRPALARVAALACCVRSGAARPPPIGPLASPRLQSCRPCARFRAPWSAAPAQSFWAGRRLTAGSLFSRPCCLCPSRQFLAQFAGSPWLARCRGFGAGRLRPWGR